MTGGRRAAPPARRQATAWSDIWQGYASHPLSGSAVQAVYDYTDAQGGPLFQVVRFGPKGFLTRRVWPDGSWTWGLQGATPVLYRLPRVRAAGTVLVVEGEKDVETAERLGLPEGWAATTNPFGACMWRPDYAAALAGKSAVLCPDTDSHGQAHLHEVAVSLVGHVGRMLVVRLPHPFKDLSEWAEAGEGTAEFAALLRTAEPLEYPRPDSEHMRVTGGVLGALDRLLALRGICYVAEDAPYRGPTFLPLEVARVIPEWVGEQEGGDPFLSIIGFEALLTAALRELRDGVDRAGERLDALEQRLHARQGQHP